MIEPNRPCCSTWVKVSTRPFYFFLLATSASLGCMGWATPAFAQARDAQPVTSPVQPGTGGPPMAPVAPSTTPGELGITLGSFLLYPTLDLRAGYDTNVFAQPAGQPAGHLHARVMRVCIDHDF